MMCAPMSAITSWSAPSSVPSLLAAILSRMMAGYLVWSCMSSSRVSASFTGRRAFSASATPMGMGEFIWMDEPNVPPTGMRITSTLLSGISKRAPSTMRTLWIDCVVAHTVMPPFASGRHTTAFGSICAW